MKAFYETTEWSDGSTCNHVYWMDDGKYKMYAYAKWGNPNDTHTFKQPIQIDTRGRKFEEVRNIYGWVETGTGIVTVNPTWKIAGSKGAEYTVEKEGSTYTCSCPGFKFRGACRHIEEVQGSELHVSVV